MKMRKRVLRWFFGLLLLGLVVFVATRKTARPALPRWESQEILRQSAQIDQREGADIALVRSLLKENLSKRDFDFAIISEAASGKKVIPLSRMKSGKRVSRALSSVVSKVVAEMNSEDSPLLGLHRINEGSRYFEDALFQELNRREDLKCEIPMTRGGKYQRSGYPDLKITDKATQEVFYLDPKLMKQGSAKSTFRTFYFEPKGSTLKITEDAAHLLIGIEHDGVDGNWHFTGWRIIDLSRLKVRLKAEFQASNRDLYGISPELEEPAPGGDAHKE